MPAALLAFANDWVDDKRHLRSLLEESKAIGKALAPLVKVGLNVLPPIHNATVDDVIGAFREHPDQIRIFHFGGHASGTTLLFEDEAGQPVEAHASGLAGYLGEQHGLVLVFLNGCGTEPQVRRLRAAGIKAVLATTHAIHDTVAAEFAEAFYAELAIRPLRNAFDSAVHAVQTRWGDDPRAVTRDVVPHDDPHTPSWPWAIDCDPAYETWMLGSESANEADPHNGPVKFLELALQLLKRAEQSVPALRYAATVAGLGAVVSLVLVGLDLDAATAIIGGLVVLGFMSLLVMFAAAAKNKASLRPLAVFFMWAFSLLAATSMSLLVSCYFFNTPKSIPCLFREECDKPGQQSPNDKPGGQSPSTGVAIPTGVSPRMIHIPAGTFVMGRNDASDLEETPAHVIDVAGFDLDSVPVTNAEYADYLRTTGRSAPPDWIIGQPLNGQARWPVTRVSWEEASAYCRHGDSRLPTEAEWEYAARGTDGRRYPWGNTHVVAMVNSRERGLGTREAAGGHPENASPFGVLDMVGNVWQWTRDDYRSYSGPMPALGVPPDAKVIRGGSFRSDSDHVTVTARNWEHAAARTETIGFRCAR